MFKRKETTIEYQGQTLKIGGLSVYRAIALRGKITKEPDGEDAEGNLKLMAEVISESILEPTTTIEEIMALDLVTFKELFEVVANNNGLKSGNESPPEPSES